MTPLTRDQITVRLYGGEDYRLYVGARLIATVYAQGDLEWLLDREDLTRQQEEWP